jgi:hypothetical protein
MKKFCFTVDDNIRFLKEITAAQPESIFEHPYLALYRRLHERYGLCVQLNLFYECEGFDLALMTERYRQEWRENADWLKLSFHSRVENVKPYENSGYDEVFADCDAVHREILRFAGEDSLASTTTIHYCLATHEGLKALRDCGVRGLLGLYGSNSSPRTSYQTSTLCAGLLRRGDILHDGDIAYAGIDVILNLFSKEKILSELVSLKDRAEIKVMIHEQYFYPDYPAYQPDFEDKLDATFAYLCENGFESSFFENIIN